MVFGPALLPERRRTVPRTDFPIILFGSVYWGGLLDWVRSAMIAEGKASEADLGLLSVTDSPTEARDLILASTREHYDGASYERQAREATRRAFGKTPDFSDPDAYGGAPPSPLATDGPERSRR